MSAPRAVVTAVVIVAALGTASCRTGARTETIPDEEISLYRGSVFEEKAPEWFEESSIDPGDGELLPRAHQEMPPVVPHLVTDFLPITPDENLCVDCHLLPLDEEGSTTPIPASHYIDFRSAPGRQGEHLVGARYDCLSCHVRRTDAAPLVGNALNTPPE